MKISAVEQYPQILPTDIIVSANYPSASPDVIATTVAAPLEQKINGVENMIYMKSSSTSSGNLTITATFDVNTNPSQAEIDVNNRVQSVMAQLPEEVKKQGIVVTRKSSVILQVVTVSSTNSLYDQLFVSNYASVNIIDTLKRIEGVGDASLFIGQASYVMRIWIKPDKLKSNELTVSEIISAIREQNSQYAIGKFGDQPSDYAYEITYNAITNSRFSTVKEFEDIILKTNKKNGSILRLKDVAKIELGTQNYNFSSTYDKKPSAAISVFLRSGANAIETADLVRQELDRLSKTFPEGIECTIPFDTTKFVKASMREVSHTFIEAIILVMVVIYLFLQSIRASIIPLIAIPVSLIGTFSFMYLFNFSINLFTLFGLILAIGIVVDDAIVVIENVERIMTTEKLSPYKATYKAMSEVTGPIIAIVLALSAVFIPVSFIGGMTGIIYKQFAITIVISIVLSGIVALTLTPVLCVKIFENNHESEKNKSEKINFFHKFNDIFDKSTKQYLKGVKFFLNHPKLSWSITFSCIILTVFLFKSLPKSLVPDEDQGYIISSIFTMPGTSFLKTDGIVKNFINDISNEYAIEHTVALSGYDVLSSALKNSSGCVFITLKDWSMRKKYTDDSRFLSRKLMGLGMTKYQDSLIMSFNPPPIIGMSTTGGFEAYLQYRGESKNFAINLQQKTQEVIEAAKKHPALTGLQTTLSINSPQYYISVNREKAKLMGVNIKSIYDALQGIIGNLYVNDFTMFGRNYNVFIQGDSKSRGTPEEINDIYVRSDKNKFLPIKSFLNITNIIGPDIIDRFNIFPAAKIIGSPAPGYSSGDALNALEEIISSILSNDYTLAWSGSAYQEREASGHSSTAFAFGIIAVFLILASLYEMWSLPLAVVISVPFAILGAVIATKLRGLNNDIYFQVGIVTLIGLSAKNAILIVEFAITEVKSGLSTYDAAIKAAELRFRPIIMTSLAFILGCLPLVFSTGCSSASRHAIGTGVVGGMLFSTLIAPFFVPLFFKTIIDLTKFNFTNPKKIEDN